mgnify:CR=1 FL=1
MSSHVEPDQVLVLFGRVDPPHSERWIQSGEPQAEGGELECRRGECVELLFCDLLALFEKGRELLQGDPVLLKRAANTRGQLDGDDAGLAFELLPP